FVGAWNGSERVDPLPSADGADVFNLATWLAAGPAGLDQDYVFVFTPSGSVVTNDLSQFDGAYPLATLTAFDQKGANLAGTGTGFSTSFFRLNQARTPYTITVSPLGSVKLTTGLVGGGASEGGTFAVAPAPPVLAAAANNAPTFDGAPMPKPASKPASLPAGVDVLLGLGSKLTLEVKAKDSDGDPVFVSWTCATGGAFSTGPNTPMEWDPAANAWVLRTTFEPPPGAGPNIDYPLVCTISDPAGASATATIGAGGVVRTTENSHIYFQTDRDGNDEIYQINPDGSEPVNLSNYPGPDRMPRASFGVDQVLFLSSRSGGGMKPHSLDIDALTVTKRADFTAYEVGSLDPDGNLLYANTLDLLVVDGLGTVSNHNALSGTGDGGINAAVSPDGTRLAMVGTMGFSGLRIIIANFDPTTRTFSNKAFVGTPGGDNYESFSWWSPDGLQLYYSCRAGGNWDIWRADIDPATNAGSNWINLTNTPSPSLSPAVSPDGSQVTYMEGGDIWRMDSDGNNKINLTNTPSVNESWPTWGH
ncbi:MAG: PD40 domain-containing protein, partial [Candidatus Eremiobacteraeota bacterium]|nr:PD40 domain-containing protein [Candidatus Eremiobacteraeota bacterium]